MASNPFGELLLDVASQAARAANASESTLRRVEQVSSDMNNLRTDLGQRVAKLEEAKEWNHEERRKTEERLGTGDHTFQKLQAEVGMLSKELLAVTKALGAATRETADIKKALVKREEIKSSRRWEVWKIVLNVVVPLLCSGVGTAIAYYVSKGGTP